MSHPSDRVHPTRRCLGNLDIAPPHVGLRLDELEHPLIVRAQQVPLSSRVGGAERIRSLTDRVWFKVKTSSWRGATTETEPIVSGIPQRWWLAAAGARSSDSDQHDFYARLKAEAHAAGPNSCSTAHLLPTEWDRDRLAAEVANHGIEVVHQIVRHAAAQSLMNGFMIGDRDVRVRLKMHADSRAYLAVGVTGSGDASFMVTLLAAFPGVPTVDWMPEPSEILGLELAPGEILWSTMISPEAQAELLDLAGTDALD